MRGTAQAQTRLCVPIRWSEFRIETHVATLELIDKLHMLQDRHIGQEILDAEQLPPAWVTDNQIRPEPRTDQTLKDRTDRFGAKDLGLKIRGPGVTNRNPCGRAGVVAMQSNLGQAAGGGTANGRNLIAACGESGCQVQVLRWKVLVNEENAQEAASTPT